MSTNESSELEKIKAAAYIGCLQWALSEDEVMREFSRDTGTMIVTKPGSPLERMIDQVTRVNEQVIERFIPWFNENVWGEEPPPGALREEPMNAKDAE